MKTLTNFFIWIIFGGLAGWLGSAIAGSSLSLIGNIVTGIVGSILGGFIAGLLGIHLSKQFSIKSFLTAVLGSALLLFIINLIF